MCTTFWRACLCYTISLYLCYAVIGRTEAEGLVFLIVQRTAWTKMRLNSRRVYLEIPCLERKGFEPSLFL